MESNQGLLKLHIGCGTKIREGYLNIDEYVKAPGILNVDVFKLPIEDNFVDEIFTEHMLEHLSKYEVPEALREWARVLKKNGKLIMNLPNLEWCLQQWLAKPEEERWNWQLDTIFGLQTHPGEYHKTGFTKSRLRELLRNVGFKEITIDDYWSHGQSCFWVEASKSNSSENITSDRNQFNPTSVHNDERKNTLISIVVPWWDHTDLLNIWKNNLKHLGKNEVIFVDNGSQSQGKLELEEFCKQHEIQLIRNEENRGFSAANNQGLGVATGEYILYLNNDVEISKFPAQLFCNLAGEGISGPGFVQNELGENYLEGWALCIKKSTLETLGGWCEDYGPGYWDDVDLCLRARLAGYTLTPIPNIQTFMRHKQNTTGRDGRLDQIALHVRNRGIFLQKHYSIHPKIVIDGVFFQLQQTGIARVWKSLLSEWSSNDFAKHIIVLDRAGTAPKIPGIRYRQIPQYNYNDTNTDREMLQQICDEEGADLFISSYYTTPLTTPSVFMAYDMIPEIMGWDLSNPMWQEKHHAIQQASAYISISKNTASDLVKCFPDISPESVTVAYCGIQNIFTPAQPEEVNGFKSKYGITKPYFLIVSSSKAYKNITLFFKAFVQFASRNGFDIVCTGSGGALAPEWRTYTSGSAVHMLQLSDSELAIAYSGAIALAYPSKYEGFGLPILEAMACGCPVITCANASIPEVAGEAAIYVNDNDAEGLANALCEVQKPAIRQLLINRGIEQAKKFSWSSMAKTVASVLIDTTIQALNLREINLIIFPDWTQSEENIAAELEKVIGTLATHADSQSMTLLIDISNSDGDYAEMLLSAVSMNLLMQDLDISEDLEISLVSQLGEMQWKALLPRIQARIVLEWENKQAIAQIQADSLSSYELDSFVNQYRRERLEPSTLDELHRLRIQIAKLWLNTEEHLLEKVYLGKVGETIKTLLKSGIQDEALIETEEHFVTEVLAQIAKGFKEPKAIQYLLVGMLYYRPHQLTLTYNLTCIPNWLLNDYLEFSLQPPTYFQKIGEADNYYQYMEQWIDYLHSNIFSKTDSSLWQDVAEHFTRKSSFIPLYFNNINLKNIYTKRADIIEFCLKQNEHQIEYDFPKRSLERNKIRLGILASHLNPQTETFAALSVYKHLNRELFEVILFTLNVSNHRLERYCSGHADAFVQLPADLVSQVQVIREADLDILFISTNVTAVTHQITLLALHRLARLQIVDANSPVTTGMNNIDYYISSKLSEPEKNAHKHYTEQLITLNSTPQCFDFATEEKVVATTSINRESLGIGKNSIVYISGANYYKIIPELEAVWAKIIAKVPNSVLLLYPFNPNWSSSYPAVAFQKRIATTFAQHGVAEDKLILLDCVPNRADVKERLKLSDIYLDSYPYSGMTSLIDPLEVGLPTVLMETECSRSRKAASLLRELQIPDLITNSEEAYIELAVALGTDTKLCQQKAEQIKQRMQKNPCFLDSRSHSEKMGELFQELFQKHQVTAIENLLNLKEFNFIIFPNWSQSEEILYQELGHVIASLSNHPDKTEMTLLISIGHLSEDDVSLFLSDVVMNLMLEENLDITDDPQISLIGQLGKMQWETLLPQIQARIVLQSENKEAIAQVKADTLPCCELDNFSKKLLTAL